jgi:hypothetical protein
MAEFVGPFLLDLASDVTRNGLGLQLLDAEENFVAEIFRSDADHTVRLTTWGNEVPLAAIELLVRSARDALDPFVDGTPLAASNDMRTDDARKTP